MSSSPHAQSETPIAAILFDWDGTTGVPWSHVEVPFPQVRAMFQHLFINNIHQGLVSFNPHAFCALNSHDLHTYLTAFRAGCNQAWDHEDLSQYHDAMRKGLSKSAQMHDILANEWKHLNLNPSQVLLIDDDMKNINDARQAGFQALFIKDSWLGLHWPELKAFPTMPRMLEPEPRTLRHLHSNDHDVAILKLGLLTDFASKIQKHHPERMNELLEYAGRLSKHLGVGYGGDAAQPKQQQISPVTTTRFKVDLGYHSTSSINTHGWTATMSRYSLKGDAGLLPGEIVVPRSKMVLHISQPRALSSVVRAIDMARGFTRAELANELAALYIRSAALLEEDHKDPFATSNGMMVSVDVELGHDVADVYSKLDF